MKCKADPPGWRKEYGKEPWWYEGGVNYNKDHVPVEGKYDGKAVYFCLYCGKRLS